MATTTRRSKAAKKRPPTRNRPGSRKRKPSKWEMTFAAVRSERMAGSDAGVQVPRAGRAIPQEAAVILRKLSLDELPQVFNVLAGQMSIVGPRMITPEEQTRYGQWDLNLLTVKPGLTGLWQVSGRSDISYDQRVQLDMNYIRNWTIWFDLQILLQTIPAVVKRRGAY